MNPYFVMPTLKNYLCSKRKLDTHSFYVLRRPEHLFKSLDSQNITIQYHPKNEKQKKLLIEMIEFLNRAGKNVTVTEFERIFDDDLLLQLADRNIDFKLCLRYMLESYHSSYNLEMSYMLKEYQEIIKKVKYFKDKVTEICQTEEEKICFVLYQLGTYIKYPYIEEMSDMELTVVSDFYASIGRGEAVCVGYSMALWKILVELHIPCHIILGYVPYNGKNVGHAWNQVCMNGTWYNVDLTWFSGVEKSEHLLQSDANFKYHIANTENQKEVCLESYPREKLAYFLEEMKKYPNYLKEYDYKLEEEKKNSF